MAEERERIRRIEAEETKAFLKWREILLDLGARRRKAIATLTTTQQQHQQQLQKNADKEKERDKERVKEKEVYLKRNEVVKKAVETSGTAALAASGTVGVEERGDGGAVGDPSFSSTAAITSWQSGDTIALQDLLDCVDDLCPSFTMRAFRYMHEARALKRFASQPKEQVLVLKRITSLVSMEDYSKFSLTAPFMPVLSEALAYAYGTIVKFFATVATPDVYQSRAYVSAATMLISHPIAGRFFPPEIPRYIDKSIL